MSNRFDLCSPRPKKDGGTFWHRVGVMFADDKGGFSIMLDSLPIPDKEGRLVVKAFPPKDQDNRQGSQPYNAPAQPSGGGGSFNDEDSIPFLREDR